MLIIYWIFSALLVGVDQLVKWWITDNLALGETKNLIPGILSLNH
ncbi:signal peptidase II, partial [Enterococcus faecium]|nr:signal peptidase II [Enterococcus faecium]